MKKYHDVKDIAFRAGKMHLLIDGKIHEFILSRVSTKLAGAGPAERENYEVSPSGYGIHWPSLDEDLSIDGLLGIRRELPPPKRPTARGRAAATDGRAGRG
jgi:hypothetical protein